MTDYFQNRIELNQAPDLTSNDTHGLKDSYIQGHEPNPGINSGMGFQIIAIPNDGPNGPSVKEFPSQSADTDFSPSNTVGNPMSR